MRIIINKFGQYYKRKPIKHALRLAVYKRDNFTCQYCGLHTNETELQIDHIIPVSRGGTNYIDNLITACATCNKKKGTRLEQGKQVPDIDKLNRLAEALGTTVAYLSGETIEAVLQKGTLRKPPAPDDSETKENRLIIRNNDMYVNLPETSEGLDVLRRFLDMQAAKNPVMKPATVQA